MPEKGPRYYSYLLRLWQIDGDGASIWRASLETPGTGERRGFADLNELFTFLKARTGKQMSKSAHMKGESDES